MTIYNISASTSKYNILKKQTNIVLNAHRTALTVAYQVHFAEILSTEVDYNKYYTSYICRSGLFLFHFQRKFVEKNE
jgi:hypothetical protein